MKPNYSLVDKNISICLNQSINRYSKLPLSLNVMKNSLKWVNMQTLAQQFLTGISCK